MQFRFFWLFFISLIFASGVYASAAAAIVSGATAHAQDAASAQSPASVTPQPPSQVRTDTPSGYPVPRFVALKNAKTYCRAGPSFSHPIRFTYLKRNAPLLVVAETVDHWRKVRDPDGDECWAHRSVLRAPAHAYLLIEAALHVKPNENARIRAHIAAHALVKVETEQDGWALVKSGPLRGWMRKDALWGLASAAPFAAHD